MSESQGYLLALRDTLMSMTRGNFTDKHDSEEDIHV